MVKSRIVMLADLDYFFAQCEEHRNSELKTKAVVVGVYSGRTEDSGAVSTANYIARQFGVHSGLPLHIAQRKLQNVDTIFLPVDFNYYKQISDKIMFSLRSYSDIFEQVGIDEAYLDISVRVNGNFKSGYALAEKIKSEVKKKVGISFSVGLGPNKLIAKIASEINKPDGLTVVEPQNVTSFLEPLPVLSIPGVGKKTKEKMNNMGITVIGDLAKYDIQRLIESFGRTLGIYFHDSANGINNDLVHDTVKSESISRMSTLRENTRELEVLIDKTNQLIFSIHKDLLAGKFNFKRVGLTLIMADLSIRSKSKTLMTSSDNILLLQKIVKVLLESFLSESKKEIRRIGVKISQLSTKEGNQKKLSTFF